MKAQHRKELQTNVLADSLGRFLNELKSGSNTTLLILMLLVVVGVGGYYGITRLYRNSTDKNALAWVQVSKADTEKELEGVGKDYPNMTQGYLAGLERARILHLEGEQRIYSKDRDKAVEKLTEAKKLYDKAAADLRIEPALVEEAMFGSAKTRESLGELKEARAKYEQLAKTHPDSVLGKKAKTTIEDPAWKEREETYETLGKIAEANKNRPALPSLPDKWMPPPEFGSPTKPLFPAFELEQPPPEPGEMMFPSALPGATPPAPAPPIPNTKQ